MSVILDFSICASSDCSSLFFEDTTGAYSSVNTGGFNSPNASTADATAATLAITTPDDDTFSFNLLTQNPAFPTTDSTQLYYVYPSDLGMGDAALTDGLYKFVYTVTTSTSTYSKIVYQLFYCNIRCCVSNMLLKITDPDCDCQADMIASATRALSLLNSLMYAAKCGNKTVFDKLLRILNKLCRNENCETCN